MDEESEDRLSFGDQGSILEGDSCFLETSTRRKHDADRTIVGMLELMTNAKDTVEINENTISKQKEKVEQMINELQLKMQQITLETPRTAELLDEEKASEASSMRQVRCDVVAQYDMTLGSVNNGQASFFCSEKLCRAQVPESYLPQGVSVGSIVTVSVARKRAEEEFMKALISDIQEEILECKKKEMKLKEKREALYSCALL
eukprot:TRINITY_DN10009_c0_g1_i6.p2 TRINITY_DN10009_c0_g1~~TRINITY_DN10009_c0_g1_i6.p2  ORF type:complete len:203 (+),score=78.69 TRINITY_DN10009_c0_g1_i6:80-688(+)